MFWGERVSWVIHSNIGEGRFDKSGGRRWRDGICLLSDLSYPHFNLDLPPFVCFCAFHKPPRGMGSASTLNFFDICQL